MKNSISLILLMISFMLITGYIINIASKHKALKSISESDYWLKKPWKWLFEAVMFFCGGSLIFSGIFSLNNPLVYIGGAFIAMVGVFARFKKSKVFKFFHMFFAFGGFGLLGLSFSFGFHMAWYTIIIALAGLFTFSLSKNKDIRIWNLEIIIIYLLFLGLIFTSIFYE